MLFVDKITLQIEARGESDEGRWARGENIHFKFQNYSSRINGNIS